MRQLLQLYEMSFMFKSKKRDCHLTAANIAYMNTAWIKFLLSLSSCFPQFKSQVLIAGNTAVVFIRDASMCLFVEEKGARDATTATTPATASRPSVWLPTTTTHVWERRLSKATGGISPSTSSYPL